MDVCHGGNDPPGAVQEGCNENLEKHDELGGGFFYMFTPTSTWGNDPI